MYSRLYLAYMSIIIRYALFSDLPYLYDICLKTGAEGADATPEFTDPWLIGQYYAAPYLVYNSRYCLVAEKDHIPRGYLVGTDNTVQFNQWFEKVWLPPIRRRYPEAQGESQNTASKRETDMISRLHRPVYTPDKTTEPWITDYPAHFHIDLLPELQGQGIGTTLIEEFFRQLVLAKCPGVHLDVSKRNTGAVTFYEKTGFVVLTEDSRGITMGKLC